MTQAVEQFLKNANKHFELKIPSRKIVFCNDLQEVTEWPVQQFAEFQRNPGSTNFSKVTSYYQYQNIGALYFGDTGPRIILNTEKKLIILEYPYRDEDDIELLSYDEEMESTVPGYEDKGAVDLNLWWILFCDYEQYKTLHGLSDTDMEKRDNIVIIEWEKDLLTINTNTDELTTVLS